MPTAGTTTRRSTIDDVAKYVRARARHGGKLMLDFAGLAVELDLGRVGQVGVEGLAAWNAGQSLI